MSTEEGSPEPEQDNLLYDDWYINDPQEPAVPPHEIILPCDPTLSEGLYHLILAPVSLCTLLLLSFLIRRRKLCITCCWGFPAVLSPLNLLEGSGNNWVPCAVFGLLFSSVCRLLLDPTALNFMPEIGRSHKGQVCWMSPDGESREASKLILPILLLFYRYYSLLSTVPQICCLLLLSGIYPALLLQKLRRPSHSEQKSDRNYYLSYLKSLLRRKPSKSSKDSVSIGSLVSLNLCSYLCPANTGFHLSLRSVLAVTVSILSAYQVALLLLVGFLPTVQKIRGAIDAEFILMLAGFGLNIDEDRFKAVEYTVYYVWTVEVCYIAALVLSCTVTITMLLRSLVKHRWALQSLCAGQVSQVFLTSRSLQPSPPALASWMSHVSYQAAVTCIGLILQHVILFLVHLIVTFLMIIPIAYGKFQIILHILEKTWPFWCLLFLVTVVQHLCTRFIFLQGNPGQITNRRSLFLLTYLLLPVNILRGGLLSIARLLVSVIFNVIHFCRLDLSLLQHSVQGWDPGYRNYCNFLALEATECHPLVRAFCQLLKPPSWKRADLEEGIHLMPADGRYLKGARSHLARARWSLAYTLIHNPPLLCHRRTRSVNGGSPLHPT